MNENRKGLFTGIKEIFSFTAMQTIKGKGFISSTVVIGIIIALILGGICVLQAVDFGDDDTSYEEEWNNAECSFETIKEVYLLNNTSYKTDSVKKLFSGTESAVKEKLGKEIQVIDSLSNDITSKKDIVILSVKENDGMTGGISVNILTTFNSTVDGEELDTFVNQVSVSTQYAVYAVGMLDQQALGFISLPTNVENVGMEKNTDSMGMMIAKMIIPMIFTLAMYMIILIHGQSISKAIVADKTSKLIEMLLTSVRPYAIIAGKVLGVVSVAICQMFIWIGCGFAGYFIGNTIAKSTNPKYVNYIGEIINLMQSDTQGVAFSVTAVVIALAMVVVGFFMYCVLAAFSGAFVSKIEDLSAASTIFQLPVVIAFLVSYLVGIAASAGENVDRALQMAIYMIPVTSPFSAPTGILLGDINILQGIISLAILCIFSIIMILATGKVYKGKIFNKH